MCRAWRWAMIFETFPVTSRLSAWYAGPGLFALAVCLIALAWGTRTALAGQPLSRRPFGRLGGYSMMRRSLLALWLAAALAAPLLAQEGFPLFTTDFPPEEFAARRAKVYEAIGADAFAVVQGAPSPAGLHALPPVQRVLLPLRHRGAARLPAPRRTARRRRRSSFPTATRAASGARARCSRPKTPTRSRSSRASTPWPRPTVLAEQIEGRYLRGGTARPVHAARPGRRRLDEPRPRAALYGRRRRRTLRRAALARGQLRRGSSRERFPFFEIKTSPRRSTRCA